MSVIQIHNTYESNDIKDENESKQSQIEIHNMFGDLTMVAYESSDNNDENESKQSTIEIHNMFGDLTMVVYESSDNDENETNAVTQSLASISDQERTKNMFGVICFKAGDHKYASVEVCKQLLNEYNINVQYIVSSRKGKIAPIYCVFKYYADTNNLDQQTKHMQNVVFQMCKKYQQNAPNGSQV